MPSTSVDIGFDSTEEELKSLFSKRQIGKVLAGASHLEGFADL